MNGDDVFTRRSLLAGLAALPALPALGAVPSDPEVVVIGAGAAGLAAARALLAKGRRVAVLEAMDRIGGRAYTDRTTFGMPFDMGCAWIHAADRNPFYDFAKARGFTLAFHDLALERLYYGARRASRAELDAAGAAEEAILEAVGRAAEAGDGPASLALPIDSPAEEAAATYLGPMDMGVDLDELSTADYAMTADLDPNYLVREGYGAVIAAFGDGLPVSLGTPVRRLVSGRRSVRVETEAGTLSPKAVILTVSTGVLAAGGIAFEPALPPETEEAIAHLPMGMLAKIPMLVPGERLGLAAFEDVLLERPGRDDVYFLAFPFDLDLLVGFVGGDFGWELSAAGPEAALAFGREAVAKTFGSRAAGKIAKAAFTDWASNPFTRGAYAAAVPGRAGARAVLARPVRERIVFAGEALAGQFVQTAGGARLSGEAAAASVEALLA